MKKITLYLFAICMICFSCGEEDPAIYPLESLTDTEESNETMLINSSNTSLVLAKLEAGQKVNLGAQVALAGAPKGNATSYTYELVESPSAGVDAVLTGTIPAGELSGSLPITIDLDAFELGVPQTLIIKLVSSDLNTTLTNEVTFDFSVVCPSSLAGEYTTVAVGQSTDDCCPDPVTVEGSVTITGGDGAYSINDFSAGQYFDWYATYGITEAMATDGTLAATINDVCGVLSGSTTEPFSTEVAITGSVDPSTGVLTYTWVNGYDDTATITLTPK